MDHMEMHRAFLSDYLLIRKWGLRLLLILLVGFSYAAGFKQGRVVMLNKIVAKLEEQAAAKSDVVPEGQGEPGTFH